MHSQEHDPEGNGFRWVFCWLPANDLLISHLSKFQVSNTNLQTISFLKGEQATSVQPGFELVQMDSQIKALTN